MGLRKVGAGGLDLAGAGALRRSLDVYIGVTSGVNPGDNLNLQNTVGVSGVWDGVDHKAGIFETVGGQTTYQRYDGQPWWQLQVNTAVAGNRSIFRLRNFAQSSFRIDWRDTFRAIAGNAPGVDPTARAYVWQSWLRKPAAGDATHADICFGFHDYTSLSPSAAIARAGLLGDGALGFRYGSVNCPDGLGAGDNGPTDIDANSFQPAELINPGAAKWHTAIKIVPPLSPTLPGRWAAYHNFQLAKLFDQLANFPRGAAAVSHDFTQLEVQSYVGPHVGGSAVEGLAHNRSRFTITEDCDLGPTLSF